MNNKKVAPKKIVTKKLKVIKKAGKKTAVKKTVTKKPKAVKKAVKKAASKKKVITKSKVVKRVVKKSFKKQFNDKELAVIMKKLILEKERIFQDVIALKGDSTNKSLKDISGDLSGYSFHMADMATDLYDREFSLGLAESERERLFDLDEAIKKIQEGTYGICETCGEKIPNQRLKVMPHAKYCIKHQEEREKASADNHI